MSVALLDGGERTGLLFSWHQASPTHANTSASILVPRSAADLAPHYDLTISHPAVDMPALAAFDRWLAQAAATHRLSCALLHDGVVHEATRRLEAGTLTIGFHLDYYALWHVVDDPYARLAQAVQDANGTSVNPPARARLFTDKASAHVELRRHGLGVPATALLRPGAPDRLLHEGERFRLRLEEAGAHVFIKPANGFGRHGVVRTEATERDKLAAAVRSARTQDPRDTLLVQREVKWPVLRDDDGAERPAYWRVLYCLGEVIPFWWSDAEVKAGRPAYRWLTETEMRRHRLTPLLMFVRRLADLSQLQWFSTEICLSEGPEESCFSVHGPDGRERPLVAIDYFNDQCDVDVQSRWPGAPPDGLVQHVAARFADAAWQCHQRLASPADLLPLRAAA